MESTRAEERERENYQNDTVSSKRACRSQTINRKRGIARLESIAVIPKSPDKRRIKYDVTVLGNDDAVRVPLLDGLGAVSHCCPLLSSRPRNFFIDRVMATRTFRPCFDPAVKMIIQRLTVGGVGKDRQEDMGGSHPVENGETELSSHRSEKTMLHSDRDHLTSSLSAVVPFSFSMALEKWRGR